MKKLKKLKLLASSGWHFPNVNVFLGNIILGSWRFRDFGEGPRFQSVNEETKKKISMLEQNKEERFYLYKAGLYIPTLHLIERGRCCRSCRSCSSSTLVTLNHIRGRF